MKKLKKFNLNLLGLMTILNTSVYGNMTLEAMDEADRFYKENNVIIELFATVSEIMKILILALIVIIPLIFIYRKIKLKKEDNKKNKELNNLFIASEILCVLNLFVIYIIEMINSTAITTLYGDCFIVFIVVLSIGFILYKNFKKIN